MELGIWPGVRFTGTGAFGLLHHYWSWRSSGRAEVMAETQAVTDFMINHVAAVGAQRGEVASSILPPIEIDHGSLAVPAGEDSGSV